MQDRRPAAPSEVRVQYTTASKAVAAMVYALATRLNRAECAVKSWVLECRGGLYFCRVVPCHSNRRGKH